LVRPARKLILLILLLILNGAAWGITVRISRGAPLEVTYFDIGQGSAALIKAGPDSQILVDGGPGKRILRKLGGKINPVDKRIDLAVLTHPDRDHVEGLIHVLERWHVEKVVWNGMVKTGSASGAGQKALKEEGAEVRINREGLQLGSHLLKVKALSPPENLKEVGSDGSNEMSLVLKVRTGRTSFLFPGDITSEVEKETKTGRCSVLLAPHHGSRSSSSARFLNEVSPIVTLIQAGRDNRHDHPHEETLERMKKANTTVLRTDLEGDISILSDGNNLVIKR